MSITGYKVYSDLRWPEKTGIGHVLTSLVERKPPQVELIDLQVQGRIGSPFSPLAIAKALHRAAPIAGDGMFWSAGFVPPAACRLPVVVTVHDLTHLRFYSRLHTAYYQLFFKPLYRRAHAIVCVSDYTRREFLAWSGMPPEKVHVVYNGVGKAYAENRLTLGLPYRYVLYPGNHRGYKNLDRLLAAYAASTLPAQGIRLVMTGDANPALLAQAQALGVYPHLHFMGRVADADLPRLYKGALMVAFVSLYEGFGLPIVEGMASGVPVLTSNVSSMPEVAGDAALIVDPTSVEAITGGLNTLADDDGLRAALAEKGRARVARFDWDRSARELWDLVGHAGRAGAASAAREARSSGALG
ncbi:MAG: glycosyltransferase family 4 protein [Burkholderiales bacterium]